MIMTNDISSMYPTTIPLIVKRRPYVKVLDTARVDGDQWYTVSLLRDASQWLRESYAQHEGTLWQEHIDDQWRYDINVVDVHEKVYTMLTLRWSA
jgi:hypothetical protein